MKKRIILFSIFIGVSLVTAPLGIQGATTQAEAPEARLYLDGSYTEPQLASSIARPTSAQVADMKGIDTSNLLFSLPKGFSYIPENGDEIGVRYVEKVEEGWKVHFSIYLDAPKINLNTLSEATGSIKLSGKYDDIALYPPDSTENERDFATKILLGSDSFLLENDTKFEETDWNFATDYAIASYDIILFQNVRSETSSNTTIKVSYGNATGASLATAATVYNYTIFNEHIAGNRDIWYRLDEEILLDGNATDEVILNIDVTNAIIDERYIVSYSGDLTDSRYETVYIGGRDSDDAVSLSDVSESAHKIKPMTADQRPAINNVDLNALTDEETSELFTNLPLDFVGVATNAVNSAVGWDTASVLLAAVRDAIKANLADTTVNITAIEIDGALFTHYFGADNSDDYQEAMEDAEDKNSDTYSTAEDFLDDTFPHASVASGDGIIATLTNGTKTAEWAMNVQSAIVGMVAEKADQFSIDVHEYVTGTDNKIDDGILSIFSVDKDGDGEVETLNYTLLLMLGAAFIASIVTYMFMKKRM